MTGFLAAVLLLLGATAWLAHNRLLRLASELNIALPRLTQIGVNMPGPALFLVPALLAAALVIKEALIRRKSITLVANVVAFLLTEVVGAFYWLTLYRPHMFFVRMFGLCKSLF